MAKARETNAQRELRLMRMRGQEPATDNPFGPYWANVASSGRCEHCHLNMTTGERFLYDPFTHANYCASCGRDYLSYLVNLQPLGPSKTGINILPESS